MYTLRELSRAVEGRIKGNSGSAFRIISIDSRTVTTPSDTLFVAIRGKRHDAHKFIPEVASRGVTNFMVEYIPELLSGERDLHFVIVNDSLRALQAFAGYHRSRYSVPVVGITGSNGKTIVKEWLYQMLHRDRKIIRNPKSYNSQVGVPISVLLFDDSYDMAIFEAGISQPGEMKYLQAIIRPDIGIITNLKEAHQENFKNYEEKALEKLVLFRDSKKIIYCRNHDLVDRLIRTHVGTERLFTWSFSGDSDVVVNILERSTSGIKFNIVFGRRSATLFLPFSDEASLENALHVISFMLFEGYDINLIASRLKDLAPVEMRMELVKGINNCTIINDSYNSDMASLTIALDFLNQQGQHTLKTLILSDILQSGKDENDLYGEVSQVLRKKGITRFFGIGESLMRQKDRFVSGSFYHSTNEFLENIRPGNFTDEAILVKGARSFNFEKITRFLQQKIHTTILEINLSALIHNLNVFRSKLNPDTRIMVMVKAFSYGSGTFEIANALQYERVDYLCVAFVDEGIALREAGIKLPILVMNPEISGFSQMIDYNLEPEIFNFRSLKQLNEDLKKKNLPGYPVHIKLDSGMHRLGFVEEELDELINYLKANDHLEIRSVFSHLAAADEPEHDEFTRDQIRKFEAMSDKVLSSFTNTILRHILNSAGIERFSDAQFDMVRLGIGLYGISLSGNNELINVSTLKTTISQIKMLEKGESLGYGRAMIADNKCRIGIIPVGYADGIDRRTGNGKGTFYVNGQPVPVVGNICMDMCFINLTDITAEEGDEVIIFGEINPVWRLAGSIGTIPYEILTGISGRVKRIFIQE